MESELIHFQEKERMSQINQHQALWPQSLLITVLSDMVAARAQQPKGNFGPMHTYFPSLSLPRSNYHPNLEIRTKTLPLAPSKAMTACLQDDILVFGGSGGREKHPEFVTSEWSIASEFLKSKAGSVSRPWNLRRFFQSVCKCIGCVHQVDTAGRKGSNLAVIQR